MPRPLTVNDRAYLGRLAVRNLIDDPDDKGAGEESPMPASERMRRKRIREKARKAIRDLMLADAAEVIDLAEEVDGAENGQALMLTEYLGDGEFEAEGEDREDLFYQLLGRPPESVEM